jgi:primosomal protein N' (replication factor Y) (superfamily II helicase)
MAILFIHGRRGLYQITRCQDCKFVFECQNCTTSLVTYRTSGGSWELLCHQCQTTYPYPRKCSACSGSNIYSKLSGIDDLENRLKSDYEGSEVTRLDKLKPNVSVIYDEDDKNAFYLTTRIYDPSIDYTKFDKIIIIQAENLLTSPDYLATEEIYKSLADLLINLNPQSKLILDSSVENKLFDQLTELSNKGITPTSVRDWYQNFLEQELGNREIFGFPPFLNVLLLTTHESSNEKAKTKLEAVRDYLKPLLQKDFNELSLSSVYPAKFLKRKNLFSYHILLKYPRNYSKYFKLKSELDRLIITYNLQARLNPRHLF